MMPQEPIRDFMHRTIANLEFVRAKSGPFEVTQLVNSFLGAVVHPWERFSTDQAFQKSLSEAHRLGWPLIQKERQNDKPINTIWDLIRAVRNGLAHGNIEFRSAGSNEIKFLSVEDRYPRGHARAGQRRTGVVLSVEQLNSLLYCFTDLADDLCRRTVRPGPIAA